MGISVEVENLGPLTSARIEMGSLNVLVGQNNTGKSFFATVLHRVAVAAEASRAPTQPDIALEIPDDFRDLIAGLLPLASREEMADLAAAFQPEERTAEWLEAVASDQLVSFGKRIRSEISGAYGIDSDYLCRRTTDGDAGDSFVRVVNSQQELGISWSARVRFGGSVVEAEDDEFDGIAVTPPRATAWLAHLLTADSVGWATNFLAPERIGKIPNSADVSAACWRLLLAVGPEILLTGWPEEAIHLPAARGGILQNDRVFLGQALERLSESHARVRRDPTMTSTVTDLLKAVILNGTLSHQASASSLIAELAASFENDLGAAIELEDKGIGPPTIVAETPEGRFPLAQASAMLSELAPLLLLAKNGLSHGHWLTIDEPEAHLHPEVQRQVASFLVKLAEVGIVVILASHSDFFVAQINNHIRAHALEQLPSRETVPLTSISPEEVSALWFSRSRTNDSGCSADSVAVDRIDGISQKVFTGVMRELHIETADTLNPLLQAAAD